MFYQKLLCDKENTSWNNTVYTSLGFLVSIPEGFFPRHPRPETREAASRTLSIQNGDCGSDAALM